jgi:hypothetical protein
MSLREAAGYLVQLRDLYRLRFARGWSKRWEYQQIAPVHATATPPGRAGI